MSAVQVALVVWPVLLVPIGLLIGRAMRRADRTDSLEAATSPVVPAMAEDAAAVQGDAVVPEPTGATRADDDPGPDPTHVPGVPVPR